MCTQTHTHPCSDNVTTLFEVTLTFLEIRKLLPKSYVSLLLGKLSVYQISTLQSLCAFCYWTLPSWMKQCVIDPIHTITRSIPLDRSCLEVWYASWHGFSISVKTRPCQEAYLWSAPPDYLWEAVQRYSTLKTSLTCTCSVKTQAFWKWCSTRKRWHPELLCHSNSLVGAKKYIRSTAFLWMSLLDRSL